MIAPRIVPIVSVTGLLGLIFSAVLAFMVVDRAGDEEERDCQRSVSYRADQRAMWLYLIETAPPPESVQQAKRIDDFLAELNERIPALMCKDGNPVPAA